MLKIFLHPDEQGEIFFIPSSNLDPKLSLDEMVSRAASVYNYRSAFFEQANVYLRSKASLDMTITYYLLGNERLSESHSCGSWFPIESLPALIAGEEEMVFQLMKILQREMPFKPVASHLMPKNFTMQELQGLYENISRKTLNRGNFYRKMIKLGILDRLPPAAKPVGGRTAYRYHFNQKYYSNLEENLIEIW